MQLRSNLDRVKHQRHAVWNVLLAVIILVSTALVSAGAAQPAQAAGTTAANWEQLAAGESRWYSFEYAGDGSQVEIRLESVPAGTVGFKVYTPDQIRSLDSGRRAEPVGRGSEDALTDGVLSWSGNFTTDGTYAVVVERAAGATGTISLRLSIAGSSVTYNGPTPAATTETAGTQTSTAQSALAVKLTGKLVFQTSYGGALYTINADGTGLRRVGTGIDPKLSPDGTRIAYVSWSDPRGVWVANSDGTNATRVFDWTETRYPSWSADGRQIVFSRAKSSGGSSGTAVRDSRGPGGGRRPGPSGGAPGGGSSNEWTLGVVSAGGGTFWEPLPASETSLTPDWSPDGQWIAFTGYRGLMVQSADGQTSRQLTSDPRDTSPSWSPDGTKVAYAHRQHDHGEIYVVDVSTGMQTRLTTTPALADGTTTSSVSPAWSPDGKTIAFFTNREGRWNIWVMAADGSQAGPLFDTELSGLTLSYAFSGERAIDWSR